VRDRPSAGRPRLAIGVAPPGTVSYGVGIGLAELLNRSLAANVELVPNIGMMDAMRRLARHEIDLTLAFNLLVFHAVKTDRILGRRSDDIAALTVAYTTPAQIVVRGDSGVRTIADLRGRRVSLGGDGSGEEFCSNILFAHFGWSTKDFSNQSLDIETALARAPRSRTAAPTRSKNDGAKFVDGQDACAGATAVRNVSVEAHSRGLVTDHLAHVRGVGFRVPCPVVVPGGSAMIPFSSISQPPCGCLR